MPKKIKVSRLKSGQDFTRALSNYPGCEVLRNNGHTAVRLPDGSTEYFPNHNKDLGIGIRNKLIKHLIAAGVVLLFFVAPAWIVYFVLTYPG